MEENYKQVIGKMIRNHRKIIKIEKQAKERYWGKNIIVKIITTQKYTTKSERKRREKFISRRKVKAYVGENRRRNKRRKNVYKWNIK